MSWHESKYGGSRKLNVMTLTYRAARCMVILRFAYFYDDADVDIRFTSDVLHQGTYNQSLGKA